MPGTILLHKYTISKVLEPSNSIRYYIGEKKVSKTPVFINEIFDRTVINSYLPDFLKMSQENKADDFVECFTEDSMLYVIFSYYKGQDILKYLKQEKLNIEYRIILFKTILNKFLEYNTYPEIIKNTIVQPQNIILDENALFFNYRIDIQNTELENKLTGKDIFQGLGALLYIFFSETELQTEKGLFIIAEKCKKGIYGAIGEVMKDIQDVSGAMDKEAALKKALEQKKRYVQRIFLKVFFVFIVIIAASMLYKKFIANSIDTFLYNDVKQIGQVAVDEENDKEENRENTTVTIQPIIEEKPKELPDVQPEQDIKFELQEPIIELEEDEIYTIKVNDTLNTIAISYYNDKKYANALAEYNGIKNKNIINPGKTLKLPSKEKLDVLLPEK